jgi:hypothetical protein
MSAYLYAKQQQIVPRRFESGSKAPKIYNLKVHTGRYKGAWIQHHALGIQSIGRGTSHAWESWVRETLQNSYSTDYLR